jgi:hypothetical protein
MEWISKNNLQIKSTAQFRDEPPEDQDEPVQMCHEAKGLLGLCLQGLSSETSVHFTTDNHYSIYFKVVSIIETEIADFSNTAANCVSQEASNGSIVLESIVSGLQVNSFTYKFDENSDSGLNL